MLLQVNLYEVPETALIRELREELFIEVRIVEALAEVLSAPLHK